MKFNKKKKTFFSIIISVLRYKSFLSLKIAKFCLKMAEKKEAKIFFLLSAQRDCKFEIEPKCKIYERV